MIRPSQRKRARWQAAKKYRGVFWLAAGCTFFATIALAVGPDFQSKFLAVGWSRNAPAFSYFSVDSLGQGKLAANPVIADTNIVPGLTWVNNSCKINGRTIWRAKCDDHTLSLRSDYTAGVEAPPFVLTFNQRANHDTPPQVHGVPKLEDGSDGFQYYENGGATGCWSYYTVNALYQLGRREEARRIFYPMLAGYARGEFQGFDARGKSRDWRDWQGGGHGYEGLLVDNYYTLLAVFGDLNKEQRVSVNETLIIR
jgi:hypothetical protein